MLLVMLALIAGGQPSPAKCPTFDHSHATFEALLKTHVQSGRVDYPRFSKSGPRERLKSYLTKMGTACARDADGWSREERLAYWLNLYNATMVEVILQHYPIDSVSKIGPKAFGVFDERLANTRLVRGPISLNHLEHKIVRPRFKEPRIHFALVCAARGCPALGSEAFVAQKLDAQLTRRAKLFLNDTTKNRFEGGTLKVSSLFKWYREDFESAGANLGQYLSQFISDPSAREAANSARNIEFLEYDWALNDR